MLDLNQIELATDEDKAYRIDYWARLFKAKTWKDLKELAQKDEIFEETCDAVLNQDDKVRYWCEAREEGERIERTYHAIIAKKDAEIAEKDALISKLLAEREESRK